MIKKHPIKRRTPIRQNLFEDTGPQIFGHVLLHVEAYAGARPYDRQGQVRGIADQGPIHPLAHLLAVLLELPRANRPTAQVVIVDTAMLPQVTWIFWSAMPGPVVWCGDHDMAQRRADAHGNHVFLYIVAEA